MLLMPQRNAHIGPRVTRSDAQRHRFSFNRQPSFHALSPCCRVRHGGHCGQTHYVPRCYRVRGQEAAADL
jgi:hypothetical protein